MSLSIFGLPIEKTMPDGKQLPPVLDAAFNVLYSAPRPDLFSTDYSDQSVQNLRHAVEASGPNGLGGASPQTIGGLILLFLRMLPSPVVPCKYYSNFYHVSEIKSQALRLKQLRAFFAKIPDASKTFMYRLLPLI